MSRTRTRTATAAAVLAACAIHAAPLSRTASGQQPSVAPDEITHAILRYAFHYDGVNIRLLEGRVPEDLEPNFYAPPGTRVLASVVMGSGVLVLAKSSAPPDSLRAMYTRALEPRGWKPFEMMRRGGFVEASIDQPLILCRDGAQLQVRQMRRVAGPSDLFLHYRDGAGPCEQSRPPVFRAMSEPTFPTLHSPPTAGREVLSRCYSRISTRRGRLGTNTTVATEMSGDELLRHYARQVESDGWRPSAASGSVAAGTWTRADTSGTTELSLQVRGTGGPGVRCYHVEMNVSDAPR
jgi:hypothetical protein